MVPINIPLEIKRFFDSEHGRSLMIKGKAGTGKSILSLSILDVMGDIENSFYLSTRVANDSLYSQFNWLKDKEWRENLIDASMDFLQVLSKDQDLRHFRARKEDVVDKVETAKKMLSTMRGGKEGWRLETPEHVSRSMLNTISNSDDLIEIREIYNRVEKRLPESSLIIIDSLEAIIERYDIEARLLIKTLQKDLVERSGVNLVLVIEEEGPTKWDYLVDGYITMREDEFKGRRIRQIHLNKLRGERIMRPVYLFTLDNSLFRSFDPLTDELSIIDPKELPINDEESDSRYEKENSFSTGSRQLDELLGFGLTQGSFILLEIDESVPLSGKTDIIGPLMLNFLKLDRKLINIPLTSREDKEIKSWLRDRVEERLMDKIITFRPEKDWTLSEEAEFKTYRKRVRDVYKEALYRSKKPLLTICEWENIEDSLSYLIDNIDQQSVGKRLLDLMRENSDLTIGIIRPGLKISQKLKNISDIHLKIFSKDEALILTGEKPNLCIYNISLDEEGSPIFIPLV
ncbi:MAG: gas vesicle protein GvpD P-loop domain-containing protein [Candidatus Saliniplasma sp.]